MLNVTIDTKGRVYPRALQHLFVGLYIAEVCLIGLFAIATGASVGALGPLILMIIFLIFTALYHISLNAALGPQLNYLPKSIDAEERRLLAVENGHMDADGYEDGAAAKEGKSQVNPTVSNGNGAVDGPAQAPHKRPNFFQKWLRPDIYTDYQTMRRLVPKYGEVEYARETEETAYYNPAITSQTPLLWIPRDTMGISAQEIRDSGKVIPITDEAAYLDEKNNVVWDAQDGEPPIYEEKVYY